MIAKQVLPILAVCISIIPVASATDWGDMGDDRSGDQASEKTFLDLRHFYCAAENGKLMLRIKCSSDIPIEVQDGSDCISYELHIDSKTGGDTRYNAQWNTEYGWDYCVEIDYGYNGICGWMLEYKDKGNGNFRWSYARHVQFEMCGNEISLKIPLDAMEISNSNLHFMFETTDADSGSNENQWWFADFADSAPSYSASGLSATGYLGLAPIIVFGFAAICASCAASSKRGRQRRHSAPESDGKNARLDWQSGRFSELPA